MKRTLYLAIGLTACGLLACGPKQAETPPPTARQDPAARRDPAPPPKAQLGEACASTAACVAGLACDQGVCTAPRKEPPPPRATMEDFGIPACNEYAAMYRCFLGKLPVSVRGPAENAYQRMLTAWREGIAASKNSPAGRAAIAKGCQTAVDSFRKAMQGNPMAQECLKPAPAPAQKPAPKP